MSLCGSAKVICHVGYRHGIFFKFLIIYPYLKRFRWRALSADAEMSGSGEGYLRAGGVYVLCLRERLGRLDAAVLHAPNPPNELHLAWIVPQYLLVSVAEIMFAVSGLEFSFTQVSQLLGYKTSCLGYYNILLTFYIIGMNDFIVPWIWNGTLLSNHCWLALRVCVSMKLITQIGKPNVRNMSWVR